MNVKKNPSAAESFVRIAKVRMKDNKRRERIDENVPLQFH